jgi:hypothetical protein
MRRRSDQPTTEELIEYLRECSAISLGSFFLELFRRDCELRKEIEAKINERIENLALVRVAQIKRNLDAAGKPLEMPRKNLLNFPKSKR